MTRSIIVRSKDRITLSKELREKYGLEEGQAAIALDAGEGILIKRPRASLRGLLKGKIDLEGFEEDLREVRKEWNL